MAKVNSILKNIFGFFNLLFAVTGLAVIILAVIAHVQLSNVKELGPDTFGGVIVLYVIGFITLSISFLGAYGAFREVKWMLVVFLVCMCVGFLFLVRVSVAMTVTRPTILDIADDTMNKALPLDKSSKDIQAAMDGFQSWLQCCGLVNGAQDWESEVPESCNCNAEEEARSDTCTALPVSTFLGWPKASKREVYSQPCGPILIHYLMKIFDGTMGVFIGLTALTVLGIAFSSCLIAQINKSRLTPTIVLPPAMVFNSSPPKYNELVNEPYN